MHSQAGNIRGVSDSSSVFKGLRTALITELLPPDTCDPVAPIGPKLCGKQYLLIETLTWINITACQRY